ncbi:flavodoxin family protein [Streptomyces sulphureus]|uniref:flavodoxin family protein n=1 Tax=Streptomyces sulphureus TaxID=47758 RepID=UPI00037914D7|nr:NAD(P)H-dependent oxidoreductase [Streptomyces sulphureus]
MTRVAVVHYSSTGNTHRLAVAAAAAAEKEGAEVRLLRIADPHPDTVVPGTEAAVGEHAAASQDIPEAALDDLEWAEGIIVGTPVRFGLPASAVLRFVDATAPLSVPGKLQNKAVTAFTSGSAPHGGAETAILSLHNAFAHWGALIVPNGSTEPILFQPENGNPYGTASVSRNRPGNVHEDNLRSVEFQARRLTTIASALARGLADA